MAITKRNFQLVDNFYLYEAEQGINNGRIKTQFQLVDNYYLYLVILANAQSTLPFGNDTNAGANIIQVALPTAPAVIPDGYVFEVRNLTTNTGSTTLQINGGLVKTISDTDGNNLTAGTLVNNEIYLFTYNATTNRYELLGLARTALELWIPGTGLESARMKNTLFPNDASGDYSVAKGKSTTAFGIGSSSEGNSQNPGISGIAFGDFSHVEGEDNKGYAYSCHAEGGGNTVEPGASFAHAEGEQNMTFAVNSHVEGSGLIIGADAQNAHAEGVSNNFGVFGLCDAYACHIEGVEQIIEAGASGGHAEGFRNKLLATGIYGHAQGSRNIVSGQNGHAGGILSEANGLNSFNHSTGTGAGLSVADGDYSAILGGINNNIDINSAQSIILGGQSHFIINSTLGGILGGQGSTLNNSPGSFLLGCGGRTLTGEPFTTAVESLRVYQDFRIDPTPGNNAVGSAVLVGGTVTVANSTVKTGAKIFVMHQLVGGVIGILSTPVASIVNATSFVINSSSALDTSTVNYFIINP